MTNSMSWQERIMMMLMEMKEYQEKGIILHFVFYGYGGWIGYAYSCSICQGITMKSGPKEVDINEMGFSELDWFLKGKYKDLNLELEDEDLWTNKTLLRDYNSDYDCVADTGERYYCANCEKELRHEEIYVDLEPLCRHCESELEILTLEEDEEDEE